MELFPKTKKQNQEKAVEPAEFMEFARRGQLEDIQRQVTKFHVDLSTKDADGWTIMLHAASRGQVEVITYVVGIIEEEREKAAKAERAAAKKGKKGKKQKEEEQKQTYQGRDGSGPPVGLTEMPAAPPNIDEVEEKFPQEKFRVLSEMRGKILVYRPFKIEILGRNWMKMQKSTLPKFEISFFEKLGFGKMRNRDIKTKILTFKEFGFPKNEKSGHQNSKLDYDFDFLAQNSISKISKSASLFRIEFRFETPKFEFAVVENHKILIFASNFKFFFDQNLDFVLGYVNVPKVGRGQPYVGPPRVYNLPFRKSLATIQRETKGFKTEKAPLMRPVRDRADMRDKLQDTFTYGGGNALPKGAMGNTIGMDPKQASKVPTRPRRPSTEIDPETGLDEEKYLIFNSKIKIRFSKRFRKLFVLEAVKSLKI